MSSECCIWEEMDYMGICSNIRLSAAWLTCGLKTFLKSCRILHPHHSGILWNAETYWGWEGVRGTCVWSYVTWRLVTSEATVHILCSNPTFPTALAVIPPCLCLAVAPCPTSCVDMTCDAVLWTTSVSRRLGENRPFLNLDCHKSCDHRSHGEQTGMCTSEVRV